jgi:hypothetical protein
VLRRKALVRGADGARTGQRECAPASGQLMKIKACTIAISRARGARLSPGSHSACSISHAAIVAKRLPWDFAATACPHVNVHICMYTLSLSLSPPPVRALSLRAFYCRCRVLDVGCTWRLLPACAREERGVLDRRNLSKSVSKRVAASATRDSQINIDVH